MLILLSFWNRQTGRQSPSKGRHAEQADRTWINLIINYLRTVMILVRNNWSWSSSLQNDKIFIIWSNTYAESGWTTVMVVQWAHTVHNIILQGKITIKIILEYSSLNPQIKHYSSLPPIDWSDDNNIINWWSRGSILPPSWLSAWTIRFHFTIIHSI